MTILGALTILFGIMPFLFWDMMSYWGTEVMVEALADAMQSEGVTP